MFYFDADGFNTDPNKSTIGNQVALKTSTFWFHWNFTLDSSESITSYDCGYIDAATSKLVILANHTKSIGFAVAKNLPPEYSGRVKVYPSNLTFAVEMLKFSDQKDYRCGLVFKEVLKSGDAVTSPFDFKPANLKVQGKFNF